MWQIAECFQLEKVTSITIIFWDPTLIQHLFPVERVASKLSRRNSELKTFLINSFRGSDWGSKHNSTIKHHVSYYFPCNINERHTIILTCFDHFRVLTQWHIDPLSIVNTRMPDVGSGSVMPGLNLDSNMRPRVGIWQSRVTGLETRVWVKTCL